MAMQPNAAKEAATILNFGRAVKFRGGVDNHYEVPHEAESIGHSMATMVDKLESSGFEHLSHENNVNTFKHTATGKVINTETAPTVAGQYVHKISRK